MYIFIYTKFYLVAFRNIRISEEGTNMSFGKYQDTVL